VRALADPEWAAAARARNRAVVEARANWTTNMARVEALFESCIADRAPRGAPGRDAR